MTEGPPRNSRDDRVVADEHFYHQTPPGRRGCRVRGDRQLPYGSVLGEGGVDLGGALGERVEQLLEPLGNTVIMTATSRQSAENMGARGIREELSALRAALEDAVAVAGGGSVSTAAARESLVTALASSEAPSSTLRHASTPLLKLGWSAIARMGSTCPEAPWLTTLLGRIPNPAEQGATAATTACTGTDGCSK